MGLPRGALGDPRFEEVDLLGGEMASGGGGRHLIVGVGGDDAFEDGAFVRVFGVDGIATFDGRFCAGFGVESQVGFPLLCVGAVAMEAVIGEDGADVAIEVDLGLGLIGGAEGEVEPGENEEDAEGFEDGLAEVHGRGAGRGGDPFRRGGRERRGLLR